MLTKMVRSGDETLLLIEPYFMELLKLKSGDDVEVYVQDGTLIIEPAKSQTSA